MLASAASDDEDDSDANGDTDALLEHLHMQVNIIIKAILIL